MSIAITITTTITINITISTTISTITTTTIIITTITITLQCTPLLAHSKSGAPCMQRTLGSLKTVLSALKADDTGVSSAQSLIHALSSLSGDGADDVASVISNFLEGLGTAAGLSPDSCSGASGMGAMQSDAEVCAGYDSGFVLDVTPLQGGFDERSAPFTTLGEDTLFVDSLFQYDEEL
jgi:hypothetical protein